MHCVTCLWTLPSFPAYVAVCAFSTLVTRTPSTNGISTVVATLADSTNWDMIFDVNMVDVLHHDAVARGQHTSPRCTSESLEP